MDNLYYFRYVNFLKRHHLYEQESFDYIKNHALYIDYEKEEARDFIGCFYNYENGYLTKIRLCVPYIVDEKTLLINIHEYVHAFMLFQKLNTKYEVGDDMDVLPLFFEKLYMLEYPSQELAEYEKYLISFITEGEVCYKIAFYLQKSLLQFYQLGMSIQKLDGEVKRLVRENKQYIGNIN